MAQTSDTAGSYPSLLSQTIPQVSCSLEGRNVFTFKTRTLILKHDWLPFIKQKFRPNRAYPERNAWFLITEKHEELVVIANILGCFQVTSRPFSVGRLTTLAIY